MILKTPFMHQTKLSAHPAHADGQSPVAQPETLQEILIAATSPAPAGIDPRSGAPAISSPGTSSGTGSRFRIVAERKDESMARSVEQAVGTAPVSRWTESGKVPVEGQARLAEVRAGSPEVLNRLAASESPAVVVTAALGSAPVEAPPAMGAILPGQANGLGGESRQADARSGDRGRSSIERESETAIAPQRYALNADAERRLPASPAPQAGGANEAPLSASTHAVATQVAQGARQAANPVSGDAPEMNKNAGVELETHAPSGARGSSSVEEPRIVNTDHVVEGGITQPGQQEQVSSRPTAAHLKLNRTTPLGGSNKAEAAANEEASIRLERHGTVGDRTQASPHESDASRLHATTPHGSVPIKGQTGAETQDGANPGLARDLAGVRDGVGGQGSARDGLHAGANGQGARDTFSAMDGEASSTTWIHTGAHRAEAGFQDPALGWVGVRADMGTDGIHASLVPGSANAAEVLGGQLAGLNAHLAAQHTPVETVTLSAPEGREAEASILGQSGNQSAGDGAGDGSRAGQQASPASQGSAPAAPPAESRPTPESREVGSAIRPEGATISVMA